MEPCSVPIAPHSPPDSRGAGLSAMAGSRTNLPAMRWQLGRRVRPDRCRPASCGDEYRAQPAHPAGASRSYSTLPHPARSASGRCRRTSRRSARQADRSLRSLVNHTPTAVRGRWEPPRTSCRWRWNPVAELWAGTWSDPGPRPLKGGSTADVGSAPTAPPARPDDPVRMTVQAGPRAGGQPFGHLTDASDAVATGDASRAAGGADDAGPRDEEEEAGLRLARGDGGPFGVRAHSADQCAALRLGHAASLCRARMTGFRLPALARINRVPKLCHTAVTGKTDDLFEIKKEERCIDTERLFA